MVFYQKYRPKKFAQVVNQKPVKETLLAAIKENEVSHAYLFTGPRGTGKTTIARILARAMNCQDDSKPEPCLSCSHCQESLQENAVDTLEIDAASNRGIDDIRNLREKIKFSPISAQYKVYIIDEVHMLTEPAFNALLKILEEPPQHAIFILATTEPHKVPETILSRCQRFDFKPLDIKSIANYLAKVSKKEKIKFKKQALLMIAAAAQGSLRDALGILEQVSSATSKDVTSQSVQEILGLVEHRAIVKLIDLITKNKLQAVIKLVNKLIKQGIVADRLFESIIAYLRNILLIKFEIKSKSFQLTEEQLKKAHQQADSFSVKEINKIIDILIEAKNDSSADLPQLPLEMALIEIIGFKSAQDSESKSSDSKQVKKNHKKSAKLKSVEKSWPEIIKRLKKANHSLSGILSHCQIKRIDQKELVLVSNRPFYKKKITDIKNRRRIQKVIHRVTGYKLRINCHLQKEANMSNNSSSSTNKDEKKDKVNLAQKAKEIFN